MPGEANLARLLKDMQPELQQGKFVFLSLETFSPAIEDHAVMKFRETEGWTVIVRQEVAHTLSADTPRWAMITLTVHSDLNAVGFLAAITKRLAEAGISVNAVSAYYHDHLFIPWEKRKQAMQILLGFSR